MKVKRYVSFYILLPIVLEFLIEALSRKSLIAAVKYAINSPLLFAFNTLIIMLTLSIAMFFKREVFVCIFFIFQCFCNLLHRLLAVIPRLFYSGIQYTICKAISKTVIFIGL